MKKPFKFEYWSLLSHRLSSAFPVTVSWLSPYYFINSPRIWAMLSSIKIFTPREWRIPILTTQDSWYSLISLVKSELETWNLIPNNLRSLRQKRRAVTESSKWAWNGKRRGIRSNNRSLFLRRENLPSLLTRNLFRGFQHRKWASPSLTPKRFHAHMSEIVSRQS